VRLNSAVLNRFLVRLDVTNYVRIIRSDHAATPLGMGYGRTRFSSPTDLFTLLYLAQDTRTAIAETIVRDRFEGRVKRDLLASEFDNYAIAVIADAAPLRLVDLRYEGASVLSISTNAVRAKAQQAGRRLSQELYDRTSVDGIVYMSRITNRECVAVYDRAVSKLIAGMPAVPLKRLGSLTADLRALHITVIADVP
jgi:RES domain